MKIKEFLKNLRNSDEASKVRWLFLSTGTTFTGIILLWVVYINQITPSITDVDGSGVKAVAEVKTDFGVLKNFAAGLSLIVDQSKTFTGNIYKKIKEELPKLSKEKSVLKIDRVSENFILENLPIIPETDLPGTAKK